MQAAATFGSLTHASIMVQHEPTVLLAASSNEGAARCDRVEANTGTGPCLEAMLEQRVVHVPRIDEGNDWAAWREQATHEGYVSAIAFPAYVAPGLRVALNLYSIVADAWSSDALREAADLARRVAGTVHTRLKLAGEQATPDTRSAGELIDEAVGAIIVCNACTVQEALEAIRRTSAARGVEMHEAARAILWTLTGNGRAAYVPPRS
ncbi:GAF and ANTAR domain-containing protein [Cellulomonas sp. 179-A 4D5 NHS]|uniref:GAF and ANTAR domain-containing protein n=1 Tax=Cellulomonas sp. 179-A 4D5 NHS TaxID=3142378 RepID=UPI0039A02E91